MRLLFGKPLHETSVEDVEAFLADAGEEGLTWEAKGNKEPHRDAVRKAVAGFANANGGYLIIGAETNASDSGWTLPGVAFRADEPGTWTSSVIASGMSPLPPFEVEVFERPDGRHAVVLEVQPVLVPPCITADGAVYQRVSGQTLPVIDQQVSAGLFRRGVAARATAEETARRAAQATLDDPRVFTSDEALFSVALGPVAGPADRAALLFSRAFADAFQQDVFRGLQPEPMLGYSVAVDVQQDRLRVWTTSREMGASWTAAAYWDGACGAVFSTPGDEWYSQETASRIRQAWRVMAALAARLGGQGDAHLVVRFNEAHPAVSAKLERALEMRRWTTLAEPSDEDFASVERELERSFGGLTFED